MSFYNRRFLTRQVFDILETSLKVHKKGALDEIEYEVPFDGIHHRKTIQTQINNSMLVGGLFSLTVGFLFLFGTTDQLTLIFLTIGLMLVVAALVNRKKTVTIPTYTGEAIVLFFRNKNKQEVVDFSDQIIDASNKYLLRKYSKIDRALPIEAQVEHLQFLLNREIISEEQFEKLKSQLLGRDGKSSIGF